MTPSIRDFVPLYLPYYRDFRKQWHYNMELTECRDPTFNEVTNVELQFPTNTYYPPGLVCAKENTKWFCPTSGESGSPLMIEKNGKFVAEGIMSFIKGCGVFGFFDTSDSEQLRTTRSHSLQTNSLYQVSNNPNVYTKLSCFLPWIAEQYNMEFRESGEVDPACTTGKGDIDDITQVDNRICRSNPRGPFFFNADERTCIFPFFLDGRLIESCLQYDVGGLNFPVFTCPSYNITTKMPHEGMMINSFQSEDLNALLLDGMCPVDSSDPDSDLDPTNTTCENYDRKLPFYQCKNNCPGGEMIYNRS